MKKLLCVYVAVILLVKAVSCGILLLSGGSGLPMLLFAVSGALVALGVLEVVRQKAGKATPNELSLYFMVLALGTLFSLVYVNLEVLSDVGMFEMAITGNLFDVVVAAVAALVFFKRTPAAKESFVPQAEEPAISEVR